MVNAADTSNFNSEPEDSRRHRTFGSLEYWNQAFRDGGEFDEPFDWLASWHDLGDELSALLPGKDARVLIPGCGNAPFQLDMYDAGFQNLVCGDNSPVVIEQMMAASHASKRKIEWDLMDVTSMPYASCSFDAVIDKSLIDCLHCCDGAVQLLRIYLDEVFRVLVPGGIFVAVSCHTKAAMKAVLRGRDWHINKIDMLTPLLQEKNTASDSIITLSVCAKGLRDPAPSGNAAIAMSAHRKRNERRKAQKLERRMAQASIDEVGPDAIKARGSGY